MEKRVIRMGGKRRGKIVSDIDIARPMGSRVSVGKSLSEIRNALIEKNFGDVLELIKSDKIREFVVKALEKAPEEFWTAPASSTGNNHPPENNIKGGLVVHTRKGIRVILDFFRFYEIEDQLLKDKIIAGFILHDIKKGGDPWGDKTHLEHGPIGAFWLSKIAAIEPEPEKEDLFHVDRDLYDVILLVFNHMGAWNKPSPTPALKIGEIVTEETICNEIIQVADYWSSRKWCPFRY